MADRSRLAEILGLEEDEEFTTKVTSFTYRVHKGLLQCEGDPGEWLTAKCGTLCWLINDPSLIQKKPRFNDEEMTVLRWLHKHGKLKRLCKDKFGVTDVYLYNVGALGSNIAYYLLKPGETVDLDELFKEVKDNAD